MDDLNENFDGRVALVTGGSMGIGRAVALELARRGAKVLISARSDGGEGNRRADRRRGGRRGLRAVEHRP